MFTRVENDWTGKEDKYKREPGQHDSTPDPRLKQSAKMMEGMKGRRSLWPLKAFQLY